MTIYNNSKVYKNNNLLGSFLAGLWEGDGHVIMSKNNKRPSFHITFNSKDLALAKKLLTFMISKCGAKVGSIQHRTKENACVLHIRSIEGLILIINLINNKLRTPKAYQINHIIDWLNTNHKTEIVKHPLCYEPLTTNAWLAGFIDADGCFYVKHSLETPTKYKQILCTFSIEQRTAYPKVDQSYEQTFNLIAEFLLVNLRIRKHKNTTNNYYLIAMTSAKSKKILRAYLDKFPLLSSKYLDYKDWSRVDDLMIKKEHYIQEKTVRQIKKEMNNSRIKFNWEHLQEF